MLEEIAKVLCETPDHIKWSAVKNAYSPIETKR